MYFSNNLILQFNEKTNWFTRPFSFNKEKEIPEEEKLEKYICLNCKNLFWNATKKVSGSRSLFCFNRDEEFPKKKFRNFATCICPN